MRSWLVVLSLMAATLGLGPGAATHEGGRCEVESSEPDQMVGPLAVFLIPGPVVDGVAVYVESNGVDGIQRGDFPYGDEDCGHGPDQEIVVLHTGVSCIPESPLCGGGLPIAAELPA